MGLILLSKSFCNPKNTDDKFLLVILVNRADVTVSFPDQIYISTKH